MRWYLAHDPAPLAHVFRVLWLFWFLRDHISEARVWVDALRSVAPSPGPLARVELEWAAVATANEIGDDAAALAARQRLEPLLDTVEDPFLRATGQLALAWTAPITGDFDGALRSAATSLEQFHAQDEPFWTAQAGVALAGAEMAAGRYNHALRHLSEMRDVLDS